MDLCTAKPTSYYTWAVTRKRNDMGQASLFSPWQDLEVTQQRAIVCPYFTLPMLENECFRPEVRERVRNLRHVEHLL